jgi:hypothetical protein
MQDMESPLDKRHQSITSVPSSFAVWAAFFLLTLLMRMWEAGAEPVYWQLVCISVVFASIYLSLYFLLSQYSPLNFSLLWLAIPYFIFVWGWLHWYWAILCSVVWLLVLYRMFRWQKGDCLFRGRSHLAGFILVLAWVYLSGAGGHGHQSHDYNMHNGRLLDLINETWPVHYRDGFLLENSKNGMQRSYLVGYLGYYLPAAFFGKIAGYGWAQEFVHVWMLCGFWLALCWLWELAGKGLGVLAAMALLVFGGWDVVSILLTLYEKNSLHSQHAVWHELSDFFRGASEDTGTMDFWPVGRFGYFFGNYLSNAAQIFYSPHQTIAAWVAAGLLSSAFLRGQTRQFGFIYALMVFWSPMNLIALALFPLAACFLGGVASIRQFFSFDNIVAGLLLLLVFGCYYFAGSASANPLDWIWQQGGVAKLTGNFVLFHVLSWGVYVSIFWFSWQKIGYNERVLIVTLLLSLLLLSLVKYGLFSDLLCRGSASLRFLLLVLFLRRLEQLWALGMRRHAIVFSLLLIPGVFSFVQHVDRSFERFHEKVMPQRVIDSADGWEFLGDIDSFFVRYLSKAVPVPAD